MTNKLEILTKRSGEEPGFGQGGKDAENFLSGIGRAFGNKGGTRGAGAGKFITGGNLAQELPDESSVMNQIHNRIGCWADVEISGETGEAGEALREVNTDD